MIQTDVRFRVADPSPGVLVWQILSDDCAVLSCGVSRRVRDLRSSEQ